MVLTTDSESGKIVSRTDSHQPSALCHSIAIVAFVIVKFFSHYTIIILKMQAPYARTLSKFSYSCRNASIGLRFAAL